MSGPPTGLESASSTARLETTRFTPLVWMEVVSGRLSVFNDPVSWLVWSDEGSHYVSTGREDPQDTWKVSADGNEVERIVERCASVTDYVPGGELLVGVASQGESLGIWAVSPSEKRCIPLLPGIRNDDGAVGARWTFLPLRDSGRARHHRLSREMEWKRGRNTRSRRQVAARSPRHGSLGAPATTFLEISPPSSTPVLQARPISSFWAGLR